MSKNYVIIYNKFDSLLSKDKKEIEINDFSFTVDELRDQIAVAFGIEKNDFDILCYGKFLDYSKTLKFFGIECGTVLYILKKQTVQESPSVVPKITIDTEKTSSSGLSTENQGICIALKSALLNSSFRQVIENLSEFDNRENLMTVNNELRNDPSLFGILSDSELLHAYINKNNIKNVLKRYPYFLEVASQVSATFHEERNSMNNLNYRGSLLNYSIDTISEDEEMDESETSSISSTNTNGSLRRLSDQSFNSLLMQAYQNQNRQNQPNSAPITPDMLRQALQSTSTDTNVSQSSEAAPSASVTQELVNNGPTTNQQTEQPPVQNPEQRTTAQILIGWAPQLRQMRELGITDDIVAIQALEATNGDVQAAVNIIFSDMS